MAAAAALRIGRASFDDDPDDEPRGSPAAALNPLASPTAGPFARPAGAAAPSYRVGLTQAESVGGESIAKAVSRRASLQFRQSQLKRKHAPTPLPVGKPELTARTTHFDLLRGAELARREREAQLAGVREAEERRAMGSEDALASALERETAARLVELMHMAREEELSRLAEGRRRRVPPKPAPPLLSPLSPLAAARIPATQPSTPTSAADKAQAEAEAEAARKQAELRAAEEESKRLEEALKAQLAANKEKRAAMERLLQEQEELSRRASVVEVEAVAEAMAAAVSAVSGADEDKAEDKAEEEEEEEANPEPADDDNPEPALDLSGLEAALDAAIKQKRGTKQQIKAWQREFREAHGREPTSEDKNAIRGLYVQYKHGGKRIEALRARVTAALQAERRELKSELRAACPGAASGTDTDATDVELPTDLEGETDPEDEPGVPCDECMNGPFPSAAHAAAYRAHAACLTYFARHFDVFVQDAQGRTPLFYAAIKDFAEGISIIATASPGFGEWVDVGDTKGDTCLHAAASNACAAAVRTLLQHGAEPTMANNAGLTASHIAADAAVLDALRAHGAQLGCVDLIHRTPLRIAAADGLADNVALLLAAGVDDAAVDEDGDTALHAAARAGHVPVIAHFAQSQTLHAANAEGLRPEEVAIQAGHVDAATLLGQLAAELPRAAPVPHEWLKCVDEDSGHAYWYHQGTGESQWERPAGVSTPVAGGAGGGGEWPASISQGAGAAASVSQGAGAAAGKGGEAEWPAAADSETDAAGAGAGAETGAETADEIETGNVTDDAAEGAVDWG